MFILKRDGSTEPLNILEIQKYTSKAVEGLSGVSQSELELDAHLQFHDGMKSSQIQNTLVQTAVDKIDVDVPNWSFVAARLFLFDMYHTVNTFSGYGPLADYFNLGESSGRLVLGLKELYPLELLDEFIDPERDMQFNYLSIKTMFDRYLLKDQEGVAIELPQHMFMAIAMFLAQNEVFPISKDIAFYEKIKDIVDQKNISANIEDPEVFGRIYWTVKFYDMISKLEVMLATPTLSNARTPHHQLSSCYVGSTPDNIEGIFDAYKDQSLLSKFGGGIGWDWTAVRAGGSSIDNHQNAAGGTIPFLKIENDVAIAVDQLGTRKGAIAIYMEPWHLDILEFLDLKQNSGEERRRTHDLFPALWINDLFMKRVEADEDWTLFDPYDVPDLHETYGLEFEEQYEYYENLPHVKKETISAKDLWKIILTRYFETGSPFLCFKDNANFANPNEHTGIIRSSNLCTEIFQNTNPNYYKIRVVFDDQTIRIFDEHEIVMLDNQVAKKASKISTIDKLHGKTVYYVDKVPEHGDVAVCNLGSVNLSKINTKEDFERIIPIAIRALDNVIDLNYYPIIQTMVSNKKRRPIGLGVMGEAQLLAESQIMYGSDKHLEKIDEIMEMLSYNAIKSSALLADEKGIYPEYEGSKWSRGIFPIDIQKNDDIVKRNRVYNWNDLKENVRDKGMRNGHLMAIAPTSTISILSGTTQTVEPVYKRKWFEDNLSGLIPVVAPNLSPETYQYYVPAYDLDQMLLIKAAAVRQKWIDQGQSLNIFLNTEGTSGRVLNKIYTLAWRLGLKSTYYLRSKSPEVNEKIDDESSDVVDRSMECQTCQ